MTNRGSIRSRPPKLAIGNGGPPATPINHHLRDLRDAALAERSALSKGISPLSDSDRDRRITELNAHIRFLSTEIRRTER